MKNFIPKTCSMILALAMLLCIAMPIYAVEGDMDESVPDVAADEGYKVLISSYDEAVVRVGGELYLAVTANQFFNATEILIKYDQEKLSYDSVVIGEENLSITEMTNGYIKLIDYGTHDAIPVYVLKFNVSENIVATPEAPSSVEFEVAEAGFGTIESAASENLIPATLPSKPLVIEVRPELVSVTYNDDEFYTAYEFIEKGADVVFYPEQSTGGYYDYELPTVKVNGVEVTVSATQDGGWKIENVDGEIVIADAVRNPKSYGKVVYNDAANVVTNKTANAVYLSNISFTIPANLAPTETVGGYEYNVAVTLGGQNYTLSAPSVDEQGNRTYTIPGANIKGAVTVTVTKTDLEPTKYTVSLGGGAGTDAKFEGSATAGSSVQVDKTGTASVTLKVSINEGLNKGYHYTVKVDGVEVELDANGQVKIENITANTYVEVEKTLNVDDVTNVVQVGDQEKNYLTMNGQNMWLIQLPNHVQNTDTANYKYAGQEMFWSADHNNFVCVVISAEKPSIDASMFELISVAKTQTIASNNWDVNKSGDLDANDAQLIWNMYNNQYDNFTDVVTGEKFILADANHDGILDTKDASVIINQIRASLATE